MTIRPFYLTGKLNEETLEPGKNTYKQSIEDLSADDRNAYGQGVNSISARIRNNVTMVSNVQTGPGSDICMLANSLAHPLKALYETILNSEDISDSTKLKMANLIKDIEEVPAKFAEVRQELMNKAKRERDKQAMERELAVAKMYEDYDKQVAEEGASNEEEDDDNQPA